MNQTKDVLEHVHREVNECSTYITDLAQYQTPERWEDITETKLGDCEDYGIAKIRRLLALGWPRADLRLALVGVRDPAGDHGVACARDAEGLWWVMDNNHPYVMSPEQLNYRAWIAWGIGQDWERVSLG